MTDQHDPSELVFPEDEYRAALAAYESGDPAHAAIHVGFALCAEPDRTEWLELLDRLVDAAPDPLALAPFRDGEGSFLEAALRAYVLERLGRLDEALDLLFAAADARPDVPFLVWAERWLAKPGAAASADIGQVTAFLADRLRRHEDEPGREDGILEELSDAVPLARALLEAGRREPTFVFVCAAIHRRLGRGAEALRIAEDAFAMAPCYTSALAVAYAHESLGRQEQAAAYFARALELEPDRAGLVCEADVRDGAV